MQYFLSPNPAAPPEVFPELTEREILDLIARHETNPEIAKRLYLSPETVRTTSRTSSPNCRLQTAPRPSSVPARQG
jgi:DNA-binding NarL/FixJ family response regulator